MRKVSNEARHVWREALLDACSKNERDSMIHPARQMEFDELTARLEQATALGRIYASDGEEGLRLYCYSDDTVYERDWCPITTMARGLILDMEEKQVVATPFPKFFNVGEPNVVLPDMPFETFEKLDGSLIIIFHHRGRWRCATKGSLKSDQAKWAEEWLHSNIAVDQMNIHTTFLAEAIYPQNRIVVDYKDKEGLLLLGAYQEDGTEIPYGTLGLTEILGWELVKRHPYDSVSDLLERAKALSCNEEGWVLRFNNGLRLKIKGDEYCRVHRMIANLTPLAIWRSMESQEDLEEIRKGLPEEFWNDFDTIVKLLEKAAADILSIVEEYARQLENCSNKEIGLRLNEFPKVVQKFIFAYRKGTMMEGRTRKALFEVIRPTCNILEGYRASSAMARTQENMKE